jgi:hypothetical protein
MLFSLHLAGATRRNQAQWVILVLIGLIAYTNSVHAQIGICWKSVHPPIVVGDGALVPVVSHSSSILPAVVNNTEIHVFGLFRLDVNNSEFNGCEFVLHSGAVLAIQDPVLVRMNGSTLEGCYAMWNGINVSPQGSLIMQNCLVSDAEEAVRLGPGSLGAFFNNTFDRNWISISAPNGDFTDYVWNNTFTCSSSLYSPRAGQDSWAGISVNNNVIDITVLLGGATIFDGLQNGIVAVESQVSCYSCDFDNIYDNPDLSTGTGVGIDASNNSRIRVENSTFDKVYTGVRLQGSSANVSTSTFTNGHLGVDHVDLQDPHIVVVQDNSFETYDQAVRVIKLATGHVDVRDNVMTSDDSGFVMIDVRSLLGSTGFIRINNNMITNNNAEQGAISVWNCDFPEINDNTIEYVGSVGAYTGLVVRLSEDATVSNNTLTGQITAGNNLTTGINCTRTPRLDICCNTVDSFLVGINFFGECDNTDMTQNTLGFNDISLRIRDIGGNSFIGPQDFSGNEWSVLSQFLNAQNQGNPIFSRFRVNSPTLPVHPVTVDPGLNTWFFVDPLGGHDNCDQSTNCGSNGGGGDPFSPVDLHIVQATTTLADGVTWYARTILLRQLLDDPILLGQNGDVDSWYAAQTGSDLKSLLGYQIDMAGGLQMTTMESNAIDLYLNQLNTLSSLQRQAYVSWDSGEISQSQFDSIIAIIQNDIDINLANLGMMDQQIQSDKETRAGALLSSLQGESYTHSIAIVQQEVMALLLTAYISGGTLTLTQKDDLDDIASFCSLDYGQAVYWARAAMAVLDGTVYDEITGCAQALLNDQTTKTQKAEPLLLFSNPVRDHLRLGRIYEDIIVYDINGFAQITAEQSQRIDVSQLLPGTYLISVRDEDGNWMSERFIKL